MRVQKNVNFVSVQFICDFVLITEKRIKRGLQTQTKKDLASGKRNQGNGLIAKRKTAHFDNNSFDIQALQYVDL